MLRERKRKGVAYWCVVVSDDDRRFSFQALFLLLGHNEFLPHNKLFTKWVEKVCTVQKYTELMCVNSIFLLTGFDQAEFNMVSVIALIGWI